MGGHANRLLELLVFLERLFHSFSLLCYFIVQILSKMQMFGYANVQLFVMPIKHIKLKKKESLCIVL